MIINSKVHAMIVLIIGVVMAIIGVLFFAAGENELFKNIAELREKVDENKELSERASSDNSVRCDSIEIEIMRLAEALGYEYKRVPEAMTGLTYKFVKIEKTPSKKSKKK